MALALNKLSVMFRIYHHPIFTKAAKAMCSDHFHTKIAPCDKDQAFWTPLESLFSMRLSEM